MLWSTKVSLETHLNKSYREVIVIDKKFGRQLSKNQMTTRSLNKHFVVQSLSPVQLFWSHGLFFTKYYSWLKLMPIESVMPLNHLILCHSLLLQPSIFPSIKVFSNELAFCIRWAKDWGFSKSFQWVVRTYFI